MNQQCSNIILLMHLLVFSLITYHNVWCRTYNILVMSLPCYLISLKPKYPQQHPILTNLSLLSSPVLFGGFCDGFVTWLSLYGEELLLLHPTPKLEDHSVSAVRDCLFNIFAATPHICRPFLHPQLEDAPCSADRDPIVTVTGTHLSRYTDR